MTTNDEIKTLTQELVSKRKEFEIKACSSPLKEHYIEFYEFFQEKSALLQGYGNPIKISIMITDGKSENRQFNLIFSAYEKETTIVGEWDDILKNTKMECYYVFKPDFKGPMTEKNKVYIGALDFVLLQILSKRDEIFTKFECQILTDLNNEIMAKDYLISLAELN